MPNSDERKPNHKAINMAAKIAVAEMRGIFFRAVSSVFRFSSEWFSARVN